MSHAAILLLFTNTSSKTCTVFGYPGAANLDSSGKQIAQARRTLGGYLADCHCRGPERITLKPGAIATSVLEGTTGGGDECLRGRAVLVTPPNTERSTRFTFGAYSCGLEVHPVLAGTKTYPSS